MAAVPLDSLIGLSPACPPLLIVHFGLTLLDDVFCASVFAYPIPTCINRKTYRCLCLLYLVSDG